MARPRTMKTCPACDGKGSKKVVKEVWVKRERKIVTDYEDCHLCRGDGEVAA